jgi:hypothetical protein
MLGQLRAENDLPFGGLNSFAANSACCFHISVAASLKAVTFGHTETGAKVPAHLWRMSA